MVNIKVSKSTVIAAGIAATLVAWFLSGMLNKEQARSRAEPTTGATAEAQLPKVRVQTIHAQPFAASVKIRGRTQASRKVELRAETSGSIAALPVEKGSRVAAGDLICQLSIEARAAELAEARASLEQRKLELQGTEKLGKTGVRSETQVAAARASFEAAEALVKRMEIEMTRTEIRAPFDGILDDRPAEIGDYLRVGDPCGTIVDDDPFLVVGQVSERDVGRIEVGRPGWASLATGETFDGILRFVGITADPATRTFRAELEIENTNGVLRDGVTADIVVPIGTINAHQIPPSALTLSDAGVVGVRLADAQNIVRFAPVLIVGDGPDGIWVEGLANPARIITVGQEFVVDGQEVEPAPAREGPSS